jgi:hypothetical protein
MRFYAHHPRGGREKNEKGMKKHAKSMQIAYRCSKGINVWENTVEITVAVGYTAK